MQKKYIVKLTQVERNNLSALISSGKAPSRKLTHARILLKADCGDNGQGWTDQTISEAMDVSLATIYRVRQLFVEEGLNAALNRRLPNRQYVRKLDGVNEAHLIALACSQPPEGQARWTMRLLADRMVEFNYVESLSHETVREVLKKTNSSRG
jgi:transposase